MDVMWFEELDKDDVPIAGGKGANLGEMTKAGLPVPPGFVVTAEAYQKFLKESKIGSQIMDILKKTNVDDSSELQKASEKIRKVVMKAEMPKDLQEKILEYYDKLSESDGKKIEFVAVRSSATAEDLPSASFAGQQETFLNITRKDLLKSVQKCWSSLFTPRAIFYREKQGFPHEKVLIAVVVQKMVNSDKAGVMFTIHPATGDRDKLVIEAGWGLGEGVVSGSVTPDHYVIDKKTGALLEKEISRKEVMFVRDRSGKTVKKEVPKDKAEAQVLSEEELREIAELGKKVEEHYNYPQDIEWAIEDRRAYLLQSRPITVLYEGKESEAEAVEEKEIILKGLAASPGVVAGRVHVIESADRISEFKKGEILVTEMTSPDWVPAMKKSIAIITDSGGLTCHAAIVSRELQIPCIVGTKNATKVLKTGDYVTVDAHRGVVYRGVVEDLVEKKAEEEAAPVTAAEIAPITGTKIYVNLGEPDLAEKVAALPVDGVGLLRMEFIINDHIGEHPMHMIEEGREDEFVEKLSEGIATFCRAFYPRPVVLRFSDFKTNEYAKLKGGEKYESTIVESNPLIGFRGACRYTDPKYEPAFKLELKAVKKVRQEMGLTNLWVMVPFCRTVEEFARVRKLLEEEGLKPGDDFKLWVMAEVPSNIFLAKEFIEAGAMGFSIGSNDLLMLVLGADRDNEIMAEKYGADDPALRKAMKMLIDTAHAHGATVSICGQLPSLSYSACEFLVRCGIDSMSLNPDTAVATRKLVASIEQKILLEKALGIEKKI
jgi:pyruvate,water dikinase